VRSCTVFNIARQFGAPYLEFKGDIKCLSGQHLKPAKQSQRWKAQASNCIALLASKIRQSLTHFYYLTILGMTEKRTLQRVSLGTLTEGLRRLHTSSTVQSHMQIASEIRVT
jgi:hypothetical protein